MAKTASSRNDSQERDARTKSTRSKSLRPLSSFLGGGVTESSNSSGRPSTSDKASASSSKRQKQSNGSAVSTRPKRTAAAVASDPADAIELSSDDDVEEGIQVNDSSDDDNVIVTGFSSGNGTVASTSGTTRRKTSSTSQKTGSFVTSSSQDINAEKATSKSKGKQRAIEAVELEVVDDRVGRVSGRFSIPQSDLIAQPDAIWAEKYAPVDLESLCVHKKKAQDVQNWLEEAYAGGTTSKYRRILVLSGPAGSAKTATLQVLSRHMNFEVMEFRTSEGNSESFANQLPSFLNKVTAASSLALGTLMPDGNIAVEKQPIAVTSASGSDSQNRSQSSLEGFAKGFKSNKRSSHRRRLVLVEDLPNIFTSQGTRNAFRSAILAYAQNKRFGTTAITKDGNVPLVLIISESLMRPGQNEGEVAANRYQGSGEMSVTVRSVVPADVLRAPVTAEIKFNPVAPTLMKKALTAILNREYEHDIGRKPSPQALQLVIESADGDIRSALNTLQFVIGQGETPVDQPSAVLKPKKGKKRKSDGTEAGNSDVSVHKALLHLVATKESTLFLFHALGKVLFNKRWGDNPEEDAKSNKKPPSRPEKLPAHFSEWNRAASKVDPNVLFADAPVDSDVFMTYLHQNYPPFCNDIANSAHLTEYLSQSEALMRMEGDTFSRHALTSHYSFQVAVRGALLSLPSPVQRRGQKMYKSEMWDVMKRQRENLDTVRDWSARLAHDATDHTGDGMNKLTLQAEYIPFLGLIQAPHQSYSSASATSSQSQKSIFKAPVAPGGKSSAAAKSVKLSKALLDIAFMPAIVSGTQTGSKSALNEKEVPDIDEDDQEEKPTAPAVKVEHEDEDDWYAEKRPETVELDKLYLSDDDIGEFD